MRPLVWICSRQIPIYAAQSLRITTRIVWDLASCKVLEHEHHQYEGPICLCKESDAQKAAQQQQTALTKQQLGIEQQIASFSQQLQGIFKTQFAGQQSLLNFLTPQLESMATNPLGFGATELAALQSNLINQVGSATTSAQQETNRQFATQNEAGLPSGVQAMTNAQILSSAAGARAGGLTNIALANEQLKTQQQQFAEQELSGPVMAGSLATPSGAGVSLSGLSAASGANQGAGNLNNQAFQQATQIQNQGGLWKNILGGLMGAGLNFATGGLSNILGGGSFLNPNPPQQQQGPAAQGQTGFF